MAPFSSFHRCSIRFNVRSDLRARHFKIVRCFALCHCRFFFFLRCCNNKLPATENQAFWHCAAFLSLEYLESIEFLEYAVQIQGTARQNRAEPLPYFPVFCSRCASLWAFPTFPVWSHLYTGNSCPFIMISFLQWCPPWSSFMQSHFDPNNGAI